MSKRILSLGLLILFGLLMTACSSQAASAAPAATLPPRANPNSSSAEGHVEPVQSVNLSFGISGEVAEVRVKEGDAIKAQTIHIAADNGKLEDGRHQGVKFWPRSSGSIRRSV